MIIYVIYDGRFAVGYSRSLRKAKDIAHERGAQEIQELRISNMKNDLRLEKVRKWVKGSWSGHFIEYPV